MNQKKRNIRLILLFGVLILVTVILVLTGGRTNRLDVPKDLFTYEDTATIDKVIMGKDTLVYEGNGWLINGQKADPRRVEVLFAIVKQVKVRRPAANNQQDSLKSLMQNNGMKVILYEKNEIKDSFRVFGQEELGVTWMQKEMDDPIYLVEIPGYRSYLGGIFQLDENGWRYPMVFDVNWKNFQSAEAMYPSQPENSFKVSYGDKEFELENLTKTDTAKLNNYLNDLSLLYVNDFLFKSELNPYDSVMKHTSARVSIKDVGDNSHVMEVFGRPSGTRDMLIRIDSSDYALVDYQRIKRILKPRWFFRHQ